MNFPETSHKGEDSELWFEVMDRINSGEMPPEDKLNPLKKKSIHPIGLGLN